MPLADHIAQFHEAAEQRPEQGGAAALAEIAETNHQILAGARGAGFRPERVEAILDEWREALAATGALLETRRAAGKVRRCHGDLHLRNICLLDGEPTLFDCLEFSDALASIDVLVRPRLFADGSGASRAGAVRQPGAQPLPRPQRRG